MDKSGHFMRRFRNVNMKLSKIKSVTKPQHDFMEITPVEDSVMHLAFLYHGTGGREIKVLLTDTFMMGQEVKPNADHKRTDIEGGYVEVVKEY